MARIRIFISLVCIFAVFILYKLPRGVVDNGENNLAAKDQSHKNISDSIALSVIDAHKQALTGSQLNEISTLKEKISNSVPREAATLTDSISNIYIAANLYDSAAQCYEELLKRIPDPKYILKTADLYYNAYNFAMNRDKASFLGAKARQFYFEMLERDSSRLDIKNKIAMTYVSSSNPMRGISMLREILEKDPENEEAIMNMGLLSLQSGQYDKAVERFEQLTKINAANIQGQFYLGLCYYQLGDKEKAKTQFELVKSLGNDATMMAAVDGYLKELND